MNALFVAVTSLLRMRARRHEPWKMIIARRSIGSSSSPSPSPATVVVAYASGSAAVISALLRAAHAQACIDDLHTTLLSSNNTSEKYVTLATFSIAGVQTPRLLLLPAQERSGILIVGPQDEGHRALMERAWSAITNAGDHCNPDHDQTMVMLTSSTAARCMPASISLQYASSNLTSWRADVS